jgi:hypothetical protein
VDQFRTASLVGSRFVSNGSAGATFYVPTVRVAQSLFEEQGLTTSLQWYVYTYTGAANTLTVDTTVFRGSGTGIFAQAYYAGRVTVRGSALERGPAGFGGRLLYANLPGRVQVLDSRVDSTAYGYFAVDVYTDTLDVLNTQMHFVSGGVQAYSYSGPSLLATVTGTTIGCRTGQSGSYYGLLLYDADAVVTGNTVSGCWTGMYLYSGTPRSATIRGNVITDLDSLNGDFGIYLQGSWTKPVIAQNTVARGRMGSAGIFLYGYGTGIDSARVDSNTVQDGRGNGINLYYSTLRAASVRGNTIERMRPIPFASDNAGINVLSVSGPDTVRIVDNRLLQNRTFGMFLNTGINGAPIRVDTNVVVDDSLFAVKIEASTTVVGRGNFLARNGDGIYANGTITIDSSVIQQSARVGAQYSGGIVTLIDNYWGDASGPRCDTACPGVGDSILGVLNVAYQPFLTSAPTTPIGAPPALRPSAVFAAPASTLRAQAVEPAWFEQQRRAFAARRGGER